MLDYPDARSPTAHIYLETDPKFSSNTFVAVDKSRSSDKLPNFTKHDNTAALIRKL